MWFIGVEVEQETSASPPKKKSWIRPCIKRVTGKFLEVSSCSCAKQQAKKAKKCTKKCAARAKLLFC